MRQTRNTRQRQLVLEAVRARMDHPSADEIYLDVRRQDPRVSRGTVYRNLNILAESGEIAHVEAPSADRYDLRPEPHYHLYCLSCGAVVDAPLPYQREDDRRVAEETGFDVRCHQTIFEGLCPACRKRAERFEQ